MDTIALAIVGSGYGCCKKKSTHIKWMPSFWMQQQPIFPDRRQSSIVGASELNFCVRYENRWDLTANVTAMVYIRISPGISFSKCNIFYTFFHLPSIYLHGRFTTA